MGGGVCVSGLFRALLKHSTYDRLFVPAITSTGASDLLESPLYRECGRRLEFIGEHQLSKVRESTHAVFVTAGMDLAAMARLRRLSGCRCAPITGMIHSINYSWELRAILLLLLSPLRRHDALICSSTAGHATIAKLFGLAHERLINSGWPGLKPRFQTPIIPLGIDVPELATTAQPCP